MIKAILFDLDQTLLDRNQSLYAFLTWQVNFLSLVPQSLKAEFIQRFIDLDNNGTVWKDLVYSTLIKEFNIVRYTETFLLEQYIHDFNKFSTAFHDVGNVIQELYDQGYLLGLISNGRFPFQEHNFFALGLSEYFSSTIISEAVGLRKPDPKIFQLACQQMNVMPHECIFIGDTPKADIQGAQAVGMKAIHFNPDCTIKDICAEQNIHHFKMLWIAIKTIEKNM